MWLCSDQGTYDTSKEKNNKKITILCVKNYIIYSDFHNCPCANSIEMDLQQQKLLSTFLGYCTLLAMISHDLPITKKQCI